MFNYNEKTYGDRFADVYDDWFSSYDPALINTLAAYADGGAALELGIGTGRVAIPLKEKGIEVEGIDTSEAMVERMHAKPAGKQIPVMIASFANFSIEKKFKLVYLVFSTLFGLLTQDEQVECFQSVARHLTPDGVFVIEAFLPDMGRFTSGQTIRVTQLEDQEVRLDASQLDIVNQIISSQQVVLTEDGAQLRPVKIRYVWPAEMDLMARLAGLSLQQRVADWNGAPFTAQSSKHISVYGITKQNYV